jgi:hypothetical protein
MRCGRVSILAGAIAIACHEADSPIQVSDSGSVIAACKASSRALFAGRLATDFEGILLQVEGTDEVLGVGGELGDLVQSDSKGLIAKACFDVQLDGTCSDAGERTYPVRYWVNVSRVVESRRVQVSDGRCMPWEMNVRR